jgi:hypothetical protein
VPEVATAGGVSAEERRQALEQLLESDAFRRAEQLRRLVRYLVEQAEAGRSHEVTEYEIGRHALGRPEEFSPETDSSVRSRMHSLRHKLEEYYLESGRKREWRIEFPKGSYRPVYHPPLAEAIVAGEEPRRRDLRWAWAAAALMAAGAVIWSAGWRRESPLERLWRPILQAKQVPTLVVGQPVHLWVRDVAGEAEPLDYVHLPDPMPTSLMFETFVRPKVRAGSRLVLHPSPNAVLWGDSAGAAMTAKFLATRKRESDLLPETALKPGVALRGRPVVAFGRPEYSPAVERYLTASGGYTVGMMNELRRYAIYRPSEHSDRFLNRLASNEENHGLVTVMQDGGAPVIVFSGITSDGSIAGAEYLSNEDSVAELWRRLEREGYSEWPAAFQVVLRVTSNTGYPVSTQYEKHLVLKR